MVLWVDKHRPKTLDELDYHKKQASHFRKLVSSGDFPHLLVYGPPGSGKKTRVMCMLRELYGPGVERLRIEHQNFTTPSNRKIEISSIVSNHHIEVNPSDVGIYDRVVIQELIKNVASSEQIRMTGGKRFKVVVLSEADNLTKDAQHALRRTMEKYMANCRVILCSNSTSRVIPAIRSRCLAVRVAAPPIDDIASILQKVAKQEGCSLPNQLALRIAEKSGRNLRRAILMTEVCKEQQYPFQANQNIPDLDWEIYLKETAKQIIQEQSPRRLLEVRSRMYELISHCIPPEVN